MNDRPEYEKCVMKSDSPLISWCGERLAGVYHFLSIDHAAYNGVDEGRLTTCPECVEEISKALKHGDE